MSLSRGADHDEFDPDVTVPAELRRRLRHASKLLGEAELDDRQRLHVLMRARGHLSGTLHKLDLLVSQLAASVARVPHAIEDLPTAKFDQDDRTPALGDTGPTRTR